METNIHESEYVLGICTPIHKEQADHRKGGAGYETNIITAEMLNYENKRKFIPVLRSGNWKEVAPSFLLGINFTDLREALV